MAEMLIQSQCGLIEFLPALPAAWPNGSFRGLRVRQGGEVSARWTEGKLIEASLKAHHAGSFRIRLPQSSETLSLKVNQKAASLPVIDGVLSVDLKEGDELFLFF